jgi:aspartyl-tRNA(Asn)/glutamyl-tRNA(Gln) amidotransferase subunit B
MTSIPGVSATADRIKNYEAVIGLEVHVQLATRTKIYCACPTGFGAPPNTNVCPVCLGLPGALPVLNRRAVELAVQAALALNCRMNPISRLARKNYFYPDLPKGYQISQYELPLAEDGGIELATGGETRRIGITRVHIEDDAGKSIHEGFKDSDRYTYVDLNRCGTPLIEIVTEPDLRGAEEAYDFLTELKQTLQFVEVSTCDMEKGHLRCDANVSVRRRGEQQLGTKAEVKNLNSFRFLREALDYEIARQVAVLEAGGRIEQETRLYNPGSGETVAMRSKEHAHDYRYFPEPDLLPLKVGGAWLEAIRTAMPELPTARRRRFVESYGLREYDARVLTASRPLAEYFERTVRAAGDPVEAAKWVQGEHAAALNADGREISDSPVAPEQLGELIRLVKDGRLTGKLAKEVFVKMHATGEAPSAIVEREGLKVMGGDDLARTVHDVLAANPAQVEQYRGGKTTVLGFFVGKVMKATRGQADPRRVSELLREKLG